MDPRYVEGTLERLRRSLDLLGEVLAEAPADRRPDYYRRHHGLDGARVLSVLAGRLLRYEAYLRPRLPN